MDEGSMDEGSIGRDAPRERPADRPWRRCAFAPLILGLAVALSACGLPREYQKSPAVLSGEEYTRLLAATDWEMAETITMTVTEDAYDPLYLALRRGQAYRLTLVNDGRWTHRLDAPDFFNAVALREMGGPEGWTTTPEPFESLSVEPGGWREITFVPGIEGVYPMRDGPLFAAWGVVGRIEVWSPGGPGLVR